jgi:hypothetical protein
MHDSIQDLRDNDWKLSVEKDTLVMSKDRIKIERSPKGVKLEVENGTFNNDIWLSKEEAVAIGYIMYDSSYVDMLDFIVESNIIDELSEYANEVIKDKITIFAGSAPYEVCECEVELPFPPKNRLLTLYVKMKSGIKPVVVFDTDGNWNYTRKSYSTNVPSVIGILQISTSIQKMYESLKKEDEDDS